MRVSIGLYRNMYAYLAAVDAEADVARAKHDGNGRSDPTYSTIRNKFFYT